MLFPSFDGPSALKRQEYTSEGNELRNNLHSYRAPSPSRYGKLVTVDFILAIWTLAETGYISTLD